MTNLEERLSLLGVATDRLGSMIAESLLDSVSQILSTNTKAGSSKLKSQRVSLR